MLRYASLSPVHSAREHSGLASTLYVTVSSGMHFATLVSVTVGHLLLFLLCHVSGISQRIVWRSTLFLEINIHVALWSIQRFVLYCPFNHTVDSYFCMFFSKIFWRIINVKPFCYDQRCMWINKGFFFKQIAFYLISTDFTLRCPRSFVAVTDK